MGDMYINRTAIEDVLSRVVTFARSGDDPQRWTEELGREPVYQEDVPTASMVAPFARDWMGYALHLAPPPDTTDGAVVQVSFGANAPAFTLYPGDRLRVPRGFRRVFLNSIGAAGTVRFLTERDPLVRVERALDVADRAARALGRVRLRNVANTGDVGDDAGPLVTRSPKVVIYDSGNVAAGGAIDSGFLDTSRFRNVSAWAWNQSAVTARTLTRTASTALVSGVAQGLDGAGINCPINAITRALWGISASGGQNPAIELVTPAARFQVAAAGADVCRLVVMAQ